MQNVNIDTTEFNSLKDEIKKLFILKLNEKNLNASGELRDTTEVVFKSDDKFFSISLNLPDYYKFTDKGVNGTEKNWQSPYSFSGKMLPVDDIEKWIVIKPVIPDVGKNGKVPTTRQLAFVFAKSIPRKGIEPRNYISELKSEMNDIRDKVVNIIYDQLIKELNIE